jgi:hypothetical protein
MVKRFNVRMSIDSVTAMTIAQDCDLAGKDRQFFNDVLNNMRADIEVDTETGEAQVVGLHGMPFIKALMCAEAIGDTVGSNICEKHKQAWAFLKGFAGKRS